MSYADDIEAVSVDEALIDVSGTVEQARRAAMTDVNRPQLDLAKELAETIRKRVKETTGCESALHPSDLIQKSVSFGHSQHWNFT